MAKSTTLLALTCAAAMTAGTAFAIDTSHEARTRTGTHQFYVWCTGSLDYAATKDGASAEAAQEALWQDLKASGKTNCWPVWQGLVT